MSHEALDQKSLVLVTGAGRSGTSTIAGMLHYLGFHVPLPVLKPNESNPRGFFESTWPLWFHRRLMDRALIEQTDGRPQAVELVHAELDDDVRAELRTWLADVVASAGRVVVKDPRAIWVPDLWSETAAAVGTRIGFLTMLRHPAEVLGSRSTYYQANRPWMDPWGFSVMNLCGWVNGNLVVERQTRDERRAFVRYDDVMADWRGTLARVRDTLGLQLDHDLGPAHHEIDDFVDPGLNRHRIGWDDLDMPAELQDIAEEVWQVMSGLADHDGHDPGAEAELDRLGDRYAALYRTSAAVAVDAATARARRARADAERETRAGLDERTQEREQQEPAAAGSRHEPGPSVVRRAYAGLRRRARQGLSR